MKKKSVSIIFSAIIFLLSCSSNTDSKKENESADSKDQPSAEIKSNDVKAEAKIFKNDSLGFGYDIYMDGALYIHQPTMPAISGNMGFKTEDQAKKTADFVINKIKNNIMPPAVSPRELDSLGVLK